MITSLWAFERQDVASNFNSFLCLLDQFNAIDSMWLIQIGLIKWFNAMIELIRLNWCNWIKSNSSWPLCTALRTRWPGQGVFAGTRCTRHCIQRHLLLAFVYVTLYGMAKKRYIHCNCLYKSYYTKIPPLNIRSEKIGPDIDDIRSDRISFRTGSKRTFHLPPHKTERKTHTAALFFDGLRANLQPGFPSQFHLYNVGTYKEGAQKRYKGLFLSNVSSVGSCFFSSQNV